MKTRIPLNHHITALTREQASYSDKEIRDKRDTNVVVRVFGTGTIAVTQQNDGGQGMRGPR